MSVEHGDREKASRIDPAKVEKTFVLGQGSDADHARQLLASVPYPVIEAVTRAVDEADLTLGRSLGRRLPLAIIDHIIIKDDAKVDKVAVKATPGVIATAEAGGQ